jgi:hypothetical protein
MAVIKCNDTIRFTLPILATIVAATIVLPNSASVEADVANTNAPGAAEGTVVEAARCLGRASKS